MKMKWLPVILILSACGFQPLHSSTSTYTDQVAIAAIPEKEGQLLRRYLEQRLYGAKTPPSDAPYMLDLRLSEQQSFLGIQENAAASYGRLTMEGLYVLTHDNGDVALQNLARSINGYTVLTAPYATLAAEEDARRKGLQEIADIVARQVKVYLERQQQSQ